MRKYKLICDGNSARRQSPVSPPKTTPTRIAITWLDSEAQTIDCRFGDIGEAVPSPARGTQSWPAPSSERSLVVERNAATPFPMEQRLESGHRIVREDVRASAVRGRCILRLADARAQSPPYEHGGINE